MQHTNREGPDQPVHLKSNQGPSLLVSNYFISGLQKFMLSPDHSAQMQG